MSIKIISDSSCDIDLATAKKLDLEIVPFYVSFNGTDYSKELFDISTRDFYQKMVDNPKCFPKSSLPSIQDYSEIFEKYAKENMDIICVCITTKFSGSYNSALNASEIIKEKYPNIKIAVINSMVNTVLQGLLVKEIVRMRDKGLSFDEIVALTDKIKPTGRIIFTIGGMSYLVHGGRVGKVLANAASALKILPIITLKDGEIFPSGIAHSRKHSLSKVLEKANEHFIKENVSPNKYSFAIGYGYDIEESKTFRDEFMKAISVLGFNGEIPVEQIGSTIAVHTGPYPLGIGLIQKFDTL